MTWATSANSTCRVPARSCRRRAPKPSACSGKLNSRYDITPRLALRGTIGTGFRAPALTQLGYAQTDNRTNINPVTGEVAPSLSKLLRNDSTLARQLGAKDL